jgi:hypothetical protein
MGTKEKVIKVSKKIIVVGLALLGLGVIEFAAFYIGNAQYMDFINPGWVEPDIQNTQWSWVPISLYVSFLFLVGGFSLLSVCAYNRINKKYQLNLTQRTGGK